MFLAAGCSSVEVQKNDTSELNIVEINPSGRTQATKTVLTGLLRKYDLSPYIFTNRIQIQAQVSPHSHPILTLNTRDAQLPDRLLGQFLHEQIHWFVEARPEQQAKAMDELKKMYPTLPADPSKVAISSESTYLHLIVCYLELQALKQYLGAEKAYQQVKALDLYGWVYETVAKDEFKIAAILAKYDLARVKQLP